MCWITTIFRANVTRVRCVKMTVILFVFCGLLGSAGDFVLVVFGATDGEGGLKEEDGEFRKVHK